MRVARDSAFYRDKLAAAGVRVEDVHTAEDFRQLVPLTRKPEVPAAQKTAPPFGPMLAVPAEHIPRQSLSPGPLFIARPTDEPTGVRARQRGCRVVMDHPPVNHPAIPFYLARGYRICGYNDAFYDGDNRTAIFIAKEL